MKYCKSVFLPLTLIVSSFFAQLSFAESSVKDVVISTSGSKVRSMLSGECLRTGWDAGADECNSAISSNFSEATPKKLRKSKRNYNRSYMAFFDYDSAKLTSSAVDIIKNLLKDSSKSRYASFKLVGHSDRSGSVAYNVNLSKRRTIAVKNKLVELGVDSSNIDVKWEGEASPLVPTEDGMREPQNRRVEIKVVAKRYR